MKINKLIPWKIYRRNGIKYRIDADHLLYYFDKISGWTPSYREYNDVMGYEFEEYRTFNYSDAYTILKNSTTPRSFHLEDNENVIMHRDWGDGITIAFNKTFASLEAIDLKMSATRWIEIKG